MTGGAGFTRWASGTNKRNRQLLKGDGDTTYKNFDKSYITSYIISRKPLIFKEASPEYLRQLNAKLSYKRKQEIKRKLVVLFTSLTIGALFVLTMLFI